MYIWLDNFNTYKDALTKVLQIEMDKDYRPINSVDRRIEKQLKKYAEIYTIYEPPRKSCMVYQMPEYCSYKILFLTRRLLTKHPVRSNKKKLRHILGEGLTHNKRFPIKYEE